MAILGAKKWGNLAIGFCLSVLLRDFGLIVGCQNMLLIKFSNLDDLLQIIEDGPRLLGGQPFIVRK